MELLKERLLLEWLGNVINFYYTKKTDLQYTVRHIEDGTDNEVYSTETIRNQTFEKVITAADHVKEIDGFKLNLQIQQVWLLGLILLRM